MKQFDWVDFEKLYEKKKIYSIQKLNKLVCN